MSFLDEFKTFALRGNMIEMAIGIIIGAAFGKVVNSLVTDIIMPPLGLLVGGMDFSFLALPLKETVGDHPPVLLKYGSFVNSLIDFLIVALSIFTVIKLINRLKNEPAKAADTTKICPECQMSIPLAAKKCGHCCTNLNF